MSTSCVVPQHALSAVPGKRAARAAARQERDEQRRQQFERETAARRQREQEELARQRMLTVEREQTVAGLAGEIKAKYQQKLEQLNDPVVAQSATFLWVKEMRDKVAGPAKALVNEAWQRYKAEG